MLVNLKNESAPMLIDEQNEVHVFALLTRAYFIERGTVWIAKP